MRSPVAEVRRAEAESTWGQKIAKAREIRGRSMGLLYDRASLLAEVYEDPDFLATFASTDDAIDALDIEVADSSCIWIELYGVLKMFPDRKQWVSGKLQDLRAQREVAEKERRAAANLDVDAPQRKRTTATVREVEEARKEAEVATRRVESQGKQIERLLAENESLKAELAKAYGRIEELEKLLIPQIRG